MKEKIIKDYIRRTIIGINVWAFLLVCYSGPFLKWTKEELQQMNQRTRKLMTMHKALDPSDDLNRVYLSRKMEKEDLSVLQIV